MPFTSNLRQSRIAEAQTGLISDPWAIYFRDQDGAIAQAPTKLQGGVVSRLDQNAAIGTTAIPAPALSAGLYRVTWYARITTPGGASSSLTVGVSWIDGAVACGFSGPAMVGNTTATVQSQTFTMHVDGASPVAYTTVYAASPAGSMRYALYLILELIAIDP